MSVVFTFTDGIGHCPVSDVEEARKHIMSVVSFYGMQQSVTAGDYMKATKNILF